MDEFKDESKFKQLTAEQIDSWIMGTFLFGLVWSFGASTSAKARDAFNMLVRELIAVSLCLSYSHDQVMCRSCDH